MSVTEHGKRQTVALKLEIIRIRLYLEINEVHKHS